MKNSFKISQQYLSSVRATPPSGKGGELEETHPTLPPHISRSCCLRPGNGSSPGACASRAPALDCFHSNRLARASMAAPAYRLGHLLVLVTPQNQFIYIYISIMCAPYWLTFACAVGAAHRLTRNLVHYILQSIPALSWLNRVRYSIIRLDPSLKPHGAQRNASRTETHPRAHKHTHSLEFHLTDRLCAKLYTAIHDPRSSHKRFPGCEIWFSCQVVSVFVCMCVLWVSSSTEARRVVAGLKLQVCCISCIARALHDATCPPRI